MSKLEDSEKNGLVDFFRQQNTDVLFQVAKTMTKNILEIASEEEALDIICLHTTSSLELLNKRVITKELLFRYLHKNRVSVTKDFTKVHLVEKVIEFWKQERRKTNDVTDTNNQRLALQPTTEESEYPIHLLARKFTEWFFRKYNGTSLAMEDLWADARLDLRISATDGLDDRQSFSSQIVIETLNSVRNQFCFYFNPNLSHDGVQGRMDIHGLVLVLSCGTLHTTDHCVGIFESAFGLMRDPFSENNWKVKTLKFQLKSEGAPCQPRLLESDSLKDALCLPAPSGHLD